MRSLFYQLRRRCWGLREGACGQKEVSKHAIGSASETLRRARVTGSVVSEFGATFVFDGSAPSRRRRNLAPQADAGL